MNSWKPKKIKLKKKQIKKRIPSYQELLQVVEYYADSDDSNKAQEVLGYKWSLDDHAKYCSKIVNSWPKWKKNILWRAFNPKIDCKSCKGTGKAYCDFEHDWFACSICHGSGKKLVDN